MLEIIKRQGDLIRLANVGDTVDLRVTAIAGGEVRLQVLPRPEDLTIEALFGDNPPMFLRRQAD